MKYKYEKAYDVIDTILHLMCGEKREDGYEPTHDEMVEAMDDLKKLVGKATPKEYLYYSKEYFSVPHCPTCKKPISVKGECCLHCGQRIDWSAYRLVG